MSNEENENKTTKAWRQSFSEDFLSSMNVIDEAMLGKVRMMLYVVYDFKHVWIKYNPNKHELEVLLTFKFLRKLFRRRKVVRQIARLLHEKFPNLDIEVTEYNGDDI